MILYCNGYNVTWLELVKPYGDCACKLLHPSPFTTTPYYIRYRKPGPPTPGVRRGLGVAPRKQIHYLGDQKRYARFIGRRPSKRRVLALLMVMPRALRQRSHPQAICQTMLGGGAGADLLCYVMILAWGVCVWVTGGMLLAWGVCVWVTGGAIVRRWAVWDGRRGG